METTEHEATTGIGQPEPEMQGEEHIYVATQWQLMWGKFRRHKLALASIVVIFLFYLVALFCEFVAPYSPETFSTGKMAMPPQRIHFYDAQGRFTLRPF